MKRGKKEKETTTPKVIFPNLVWNYPPIRILFFVWEEALPWRLDCPADCPAARWSTNWCCWILLDCWTLDRAIPPFRSALTTDHRWCDMLIISIERNIKGRPLLLSSPPTQFQTVSNGFIKINWKKTNQPKPKKRKKKEKWNMTNDWRRRQMGKWRTCIASPRMIEARVGGRQPPTGVMTLWLPPKEN
jgi:hypothetical protein